MLVGRLGVRCAARPLRALTQLCFALGIHQRGVQWEGGAVDGGSIR